MSKNNIILEIAMNWCKSLVQEAGTSGMYVTVPVSFDKILKIGYTRCGCFTLKTSHKYKYIYCYNIDQMPVHVIIIIKKSDWYSVINNVSACITISSQAELFSKRIYNVC